MGMLIQIGIYEMRISSLERNPPVASGSPRIGLVKQSFDIDVSFKSVWKKAVNRIVELLVISDALVLMRYDWNEFLLL